jgi:hypothetical protein
MPSRDDSLERLARLARRAPDDDSADAMPPALPTLVLRQLRADQPQAISPWEWLSWRALPLAAAMAAVCVFLDKGQWLNRATDEQRLAQAIVQEQLLP